MSKYTYNSNAIEGNTLTLRETDMVLRGLTIDRKPLKDHMEAVGPFEFNMKPCKPGNDMLLIISISLQQLFHFK